MTVFDRAIQALTADLNLSTAAEWQAAAGGSWVGLRVVLSTPGEFIPGVSGLGARSVVATAMIRAGDLAQAPARNDLLRWGSPAVTYRIESVQPDVHGLSYDVALART